MDVPLRGLSISERAMVRECDRQGVHHSRCHYRGKLSGTLYPVLKYFAELPGTAGVSAISDPETSVTFECSPMALYLSPPARTHICRANNVRWAEVGEK